MPGKSHVLLHAQRLPRTSDQKRVDPLALCSVATALASLRPRAFRNARGCCPTVGRPHRTSWHPKQSASRPLPPCWRHGMTLESSAGRKKMNNPKCIQPSETLAKIMAAAVSRWFMAKTDQPFNRKHKAPNQPQVFLLVLMYFQQTNQPKTSTKQAFLSPSGFGLFTAQLPSFSDRQGGIRLLQKLHDLFEALGFADRPGTQTQATTTALGDLGGFMEWRIHLSGGLAGWITFLEVLKIYLKMF